MRGKRGARTICQEGRGTAEEGYSTAVPLLKAPLTRAGRGGAEGTPSAQPFFQPFPRPVKCLSPLQKGHFTALALFS
jgi:hypothetical protein